MEESIKRAEKLVHATNSALAQMKYNLMFDDLGQGEPGPSNPDKNNSDPALDLGLQQAEQEFRLEANEMLLKMEKLLDPAPFSMPRKNSTQAAKAREKIKEINKKLAIEGQRKRDMSFGSEVESSRQKLLSLINQEEFKNLKAPSSKTSFSNKDAQRNKVTSSVSTQEREFTPGKGVENVSRGSEKPVIKPGKVKEDLKRKLKETREIVDRGFLTARQLAQKVENIARIEKKNEKTPSSGKTFSEITNSKSVDLARKSESNETIDSIKCGKCHCGREKRKRKEKDRERRREREREREREMDFEKEEYETDRKFRKYKNRDREKYGEEKVKVVNIRRVELPKKRRPKLHFQRLPSVSIKGGLKLQKIYSLELPSQEKDEVKVKNNNEIRTISHEEIEKEKMNKILSEIQRENFYSSEKDVRGNHVECFNCGKLIKIQEKSKKISREIDNLLVKCNFNVFDPRIDEFVEKFGIVEKYFEDESISEISETKVSSRKEKVKKVEKELVEEKEISGEEKKDEPERRLFKIQELTDNLYKKYNDKAEELEDNHQELERILKKVFKKVDESRGFFDDLLLSTSKPNRESDKKVPQLIKTKPVVVSLINENFKSVNEEREKKERLKELSESTSSESIVVREKRKKLNKKDVKNKYKSRTRDRVTKEEVKHPEKNLLNKRTLTEKDKNNRRPPETPPILPTITTKIFNEIHEIETKHVKTPEKEIQPNKNLLLSSSSSESVREVPKLETPKPSISDSDAKTENDYESDFEGDSAGNEGNFNVEDEEDQEMEKLVKKLSTISEVDSEMERKVSELDIQESSRQFLGESTPPDDRKPNPLVDYKNDLINNIQIQEPAELKDSIKEVLNKAFESGIAYTLKHQKQALESTQVLIDNILPENCTDLPSHPSSEGSVRTFKSRINKNITSPKSARSKAEPEKPHKTCSEESLSRKSSPTEVVASLKEVLSALKDQFERTQTLADKLTDKVPTVKEEEVEDEQEEEEEIVEEIHETPKNSKDILLSSWHMLGNSNLIGDELVTNLRKMRKNVDSDLSGLRSPKSPLTLLARTNTDRRDSRDRKNEVLEDEKLKSRGNNIQTNAEFNDNSLLILEEEMSSAGEVNLEDLDAVTTGSNRKRKGPEKSESSSNSEGSFIRISSRKKSSRVSSGQSSNLERRKITSPLALGSNNEDVSYSEGEIPSNVNVSVKKCSSIQSIGEISEEISAASTLE